MRILISKIISRIQRVMLSHLINFNNIILHDIHN